MIGSNIAFIPFRSGSTRLHNKNILPLAGIPLATWSLLMANKCRQISKVVLSTDDLDFYKLVIDSASEITKLEKEILLDHRLAKYSRSDVKIFDYLKYGLSENIVADEDVLVQMLPTSPFRRLDSLQQALEMYKDSGVGRFSAAEYDFRVSFAFSIEGGSYSPLFEDCPMLTGDTQSQSHTMMYHPCGTFNIFRMGQARRAMTTIYDGCAPIIVSREESLDIDTPSDFVFMDSIADVFKHRIIKE